MTHQKSKTSVTLDSIKMVTTKNSDPSLPTWQKKEKPNPKVAVNNFLKLTL